MRGGSREIPARCVPAQDLMTLATSPAGLRVKLDGQPVATPLAFDAGVGMQRTIEGVSPQTSGGTTYTFVSWSDRGAASQDRDAGDGDHVQRELSCERGRGRRHRAGQGVGVGRREECRVGQLVAYEPGGQSVLVVGAVTRDATVRDARWSG